MSMNITCTLVIPGKPSRDIPLFQTTTSETYQILNAGRDWRVQAREFVRVVEDRWGPQSYSPAQDTRKWQRRAVGEAWTAAEKEGGKLVWGLL